jgi:hypothetical protein
MFNNKALITIGSAMLASIGNACKITPQTLLTLAFEQDPKPMMYDSSVFENWDNVPCQYYWNGAFYSLVDLNNIGPSLYTSTSSISSDTDVVFNFCQNLGAA